MKTQNDIEADICDAMSRFQQERMGRIPETIQAHLIGDLVVIRLQGVLTTAEHELVAQYPAKNGRNLLKQLRAQLIELERNALEAMLQNVIGLKPRSLHHDVSTVTGEEVVVFSLADVPANHER